MQILFADKPDYAFWDQAIAKSQVFNEAGNILLFTSSMLTLEAISNHPDILSAKSVWVNLPAISAAEILSTLPVSVKEVVVYAGWPTLLERNTWEIALANRSKDKSLLPDSQYLLKVLSKETIVLADRVGLYTPRLLSMIMNEAWFMLAEGSGTEADIDTAMLLGVNYPKGPFQWGKEIGWKSVVTLLQQVQLATGDPRYKVCPLLQEKALS